MLRLWPKRRSGGLTYAAISLLIPFLKPISSIAGGEYPVALDEGMGPEETGSGPLGLCRC